MASGTQETKFEYWYNWQEREKICILSILDLSGSVTAIFNKEKGVLAIAVPKRPPPAIILHKEDIEGTIKATEVVSEEEQAVIEGTIKATEVSEVELAEGTKATEVSEEQPVGPEADSAEQEAATDKKQQPEEDDAGEQNADRPPASPKGATPEADSAAPASDDDKEPADAERKKSVHRERLLAEETAKRRAEQHTVKGRRIEKEMATEATAAPEEAKECQKTAAAARRGFKERVAEELQGLAGSEWAEGPVDTVNKNKEVIAVAVAAFSLGLFVCRLSSKH
ncbi:hypothetical protein PVAP13_8KG018900 [Panicum virgatum]|uniref:Uncharacterized protein n=1 Tax=Panicum virgatum TaxID=38727 RepID=A0A8T0PID6_PANVG|nr:hypothetical protein PVAP13_8KG018900 [Panicum virgatum]